MTLPMLPQDKANHLIYGAVISLCTILVFTFINLPYPSLAGALFGLLAGLAKELSDYLANKSGGKHSVDKLDVLYTAIGGVIPALASAI